MKYLMVLALFIVGCGDQSSRESTLTDTYILSCTKNLSEYTTIHRCENKEVICYLGDSKVFCKFK